MRKTFWTAVLDEMVWNPNAMCRFGWVLSEEGCGVSKCKELEL